jgi:Peptidase family M23
MASPTWQPAYMQKLTDWMKNPSSFLYGRWNAFLYGGVPGEPGVPGEGGVDLGAPVGTPVYALADGPIVGAGYWTGFPLDPSGASHGVVTQRVNVPGSGQQDLYYQHITLNPAIHQCASVGSCPQQQVMRGQQIGTVGPYGETEMGFNAQWGTFWGTSHPPGTSWPTDPRPMLAALLNGTVPATGPVSPATPGTNTSSTTAQLSSISGYGEKIALVLIAFVALGFGMYVLFQKQIDSGVKKGLEVAA